MGPAKSLAGHLVDHPLRKDGKKLDCPFAREQRQQRRRPKQQRKISVMPSNFILIPCVTLSDI